NGQPTVCKKTAQPADGRNGRGASPAPGAGPGAADQPGRWRDHRNGYLRLTGVAAPDETVPAMVPSFVLSGLACIFAAICYAEFGSMVPVAGSAYTYAYATLGELFAWIIGWDLVLEYAVGSATVAHGWSHYFQDFLGILKINLPTALTNAPF